jgi:hypothetical protein
MRYRVTDFFIEIDEEYLAEHNGDEKPPPNDLTDWYGGDLEAALGLGIVEVEHAPITLELEAPDD